MDAIRLRMSWRPGAQLAVTCVSMGARNPHPHRRREFEKLLRLSLPVLPSPIDRSGGDASPWSPSSLRLCHRRRSFHPQRHGVLPAEPGAVLCPGSHNHPVGIRCGPHPMVFRIGFVPPHLRQEGRLLLIAVSSGLWQVGQLWDKPPKGAASFAQALRIRQANWTAGRLFLTHRFGGLDDHLHAISYPYFSRKIRALADQRPAYRIRRGPPTPGEKPTGSECRANSVCEAIPNAACGSRDRIARSPAE